jgi:hypothetical protein
VPPKKGYSQTLRTIQKKKSGTFYKILKTPKTLKQLTTQHQNSKKNTTNPKKTPQLKKEHNQKNPTTSPKTI